MTLRPGVQVQVLTTPPPRSSPTDTGVWFVTGTSDQGRIDAPILINSMSDFIRLLGPRTSYSVLYDALDVFFREGGGTAYVARVVGPTPVVAFRNLVDNVAGDLTCRQGNRPGFVRKLDQGRCDRRCLLRFRHLGHRREQRRARDVVRLCDAGRRSCLVSEQRLHPDHARGVCSDSDHCRCQRHHAAGDRHRRSRQHHGHPVGQRTGPVHA